MLDFLQHATLIVGVFDLLHLDDLGLFEHFDGIEALIVLGLHQMYTTKTTRTERPLDDEV